MNILKSRTLRFASVMAVMLLSLFFLFQQSAFAVFGDYYYEYTYNDYADIINNDGYVTIDGIKMLYVSLPEPSHENVALIIKGKSGDSRYEPGFYSIYDTKADVEIKKGLGDLDSALKVWSSYGYSEPTLVMRNALDKNFERKILPEDEIDTIEAFLFISIILFSFLRFLLPVFSMVLIPLCIWLIYRRKFQGGMSLFLAVIVFLLFVSLITDYVVSLDFVRGIFTILT